MENYRELSEPCFEMLKTVPGLRELFDGVRDDEDLRWEVRLDNQLTCYYNSGKLFGMTLHPRAKRLAFDFAPEYFYLDDAHRPLFAQLEEWNAGKPNDPREWLARLDQLKAVMNEWRAEKKANKEPESQQTLTRNITFAKGCYQYIDTEFAVPGYRQAFGQMDMVAVRREGERYIPVLVELKHGTAAFDGDSDDSGILGHYCKMIRLLSTSDGEARLVESIRRTWMTKVRLGLLDCPVPDTDAFGETELLFAVTGWPNGDPAVIRGYLPDTLERTVRVAISATGELYFDNAVPLAQR